MLDVIIIPLPPFNLLKETFFSTLSFIFNLVLETAKLVKLLIDFTYKYSYRAFFKTKCFPCAFILCSLR